MTVKDRGARLRVAPFTGAWIETQDFLEDEKLAARSRPSRARGLKHALGAA